jgi:hypothetical protein
MSRIVIPSGLSKSINLTILLLIVHSIIFSQTTLFKGTIKDEQTLKPIQDVNIKVYGTNKGTSTDQTGNFSLQFSKVPATLIFTCVGYASSTYDIIKISGKTVEFLLRPKSYQLQEVDISSKKYSFLFKDRDYSVLDYERLGDNLALLVFKFQLKQSELVLMSRTGDTLAFSPLPEVPPAKLFRDFLTNVHYISKAENAFQFLYNEQDNRIEFFHGKKVDSLQAYIKPFIFKMDERLYFQEGLATGFGTAFGFYEKSMGKKYIRRVINKKKITESGDDQVFYQNWNNTIPTENYFSKPSEYNEPIEFNFSQGFSSSAHFEENEARAHQFEFFKMIYPVIKINEDKIAFFNFATDTLELMNRNGKLLHAVPVSFHKGSVSKADSTKPVQLSDSDWRWGSSILTDDYSREVYAVFLKNGMVKIQKGDLEPGKLNNGTVLPFPFPEKIEIYKGDAYFLVKSDGSSDKWKLVKCRL